MDAFLTYEEMLEDTKDKKPHLLLGNGFSIAYSPTIFSYKTLIEAAIEREVISENDNLYKVFSQLGTADFESVMRALDNAQKINEIYMDESQSTLKIKEDSKLLKNHLARVITLNHPEKSTNLKEQEKSTCLAFLEHFDEIYSLNYDLLLYWVTINNQTKYKDGFGANEDCKDEDYVVYLNQNNHNIHYLHGALHLFDAGNYMKKMTWSKTDIPLVEQVKSSLNNGDYPVFISEGSSEQKLTKIRHNSYLNSSYNSFSKKGGHLVVFGTPLKENDSHIVNALVRNPMKKIYLGVKNPQDAQHIVDIFADHNQELPKAKQKTLHLYDYQTADVWGKSK